MTNKIETMNEAYHDGSNHLMCFKCGFCIPCGDCKKYGCGANKEIDNERIVR